MSLGDVERVKLPRQTDYIEWTFLARVISRFAVARRDGAEMCVRLLLDLVETLVESTCRSKFPRTKIGPSGMLSYQVSVSTLDLDELNILVEFEFEFKLKFEVNFKFRFEFRFEVQGRVEVELHLEVNIIWRRR